MTTWLVCSSGGHLDELFELAERFSAGSGRLWLTPQTMHAESLLAEQPATYVPAIGARQVGAAIRSLPAAFRLARHTKPTLLVTTGAALCVPYVLAARALRVPVRYIDSATRLAAPSLTGRIMRALPGVELFYQSTGWLRPWRSTTSVFDGFEPAELASTAQLSQTVGRIVVTLGTERFDFVRAVKAIADALPHGADVTWQLGHTAAPAGLPGDVRGFVPFAELAGMIAEADVVITHAGVGSILTALRSGKRPVVVPRRGALGEHVDDHQVDLTLTLVSSGLVVDGEATGVAAAIDDAASHGARRRAHARDV